MYFQQLFLTWFILLTLFSIFFFQMVSWWLWRYILALMLLNLASPSLVTPPPCPPECICLSQTQVSKRRQRRACVCIGFKSRNNIAHCGHVHDDKLFSAGLSDWVDAGIFQDWNIHDRDSRHILTWGGWFINSVSNLSLVKFFLITNYLI